MSHKQESAECPLCDGQYKVSYLRKHINDEEKHKSKQTSGEIANDPPSLQPENSYTQNESNKNGENDFRFIGDSIFH